MRADLSPLPSPGRLTRGEEMFSNVDDISCLFMSDEELEDYEHACAAEFYREYESYPFFIEPEGMSELAVLVQSSLLGLLTVGIVYITWGTYV